MAKYVFPVYEDGDMVIRTVVANSEKDAETEIMNYYNSIFSEPIDAINWAEFVQLLDDNYYTLLGDLVELPELESELFEINGK